LAYVNVQNAFYAGKELRPRHLAQALAMGQKAVEIDARDPTARFALGRAQSLNGEPDRALEELAIAIRLNPSFAQAQLAVGFTHTCNQSPKMALPHFERFSELSPWDPHTWTNHHMCGMAHYWLGELEEGEKRCRRAIAEANATYWPFATLVSLLGTAGDFRAGKKALDTLLSCRPGYSVSVASDDFFFLNDPENLGRYLDGLRAAGLPE
jgi:tetratricopeptide (TPR) repeat protein